jgi:chloramphenicol-sensitive protein RarD
LKATVDNSSQSMDRPFPIGIVFAGSAFLIWGLSPVYWKMLGHVPAFEILMHRMIWSFVFLAPLLLIQRRGGELIQALRNPRVVLILTVTTLIVGCNWFLFIWAINSGHVLQTSLGYYINPLVNVFLGRIFLQERLRPAQKIAVLIAGIGVLFLTLGFGRFPWVALMLAFTFGFYGLIHKVAPVGSLVGLAVETWILSLPASVYLFYIDAMGQGAFFRVDRQTDFLLMGAALVTALPLLLFTMGARRLHLSTLGLLQYISPSCTFLLAVLVYREPFEPVQLWTFILIWTALGIYTVDSLRHYRRRLPTLPTTDFSRQ